MGLSPQARLEYSAQRANQPAWLQAQHAHVMEQQQSLLAEASRAKAALAEASARQRQGAQVSSPPGARSPSQNIMAADSSYVGLSGGNEIQQQQQQRQQQAQPHQQQAPRRKNTVGDYSGMGSINSPSSSSAAGIAQAAAARSAAAASGASVRYVPAPVHVHSSLDVSGGGDVSAPYVALQDDGDHGAPSAPLRSPMHASAESKEDGEARAWQRQQQVEADAAFAAQMERRLNALHVSKPEEKAPAARPATAAANKREPLLANMI